MFILLFYHVVHCTLFSSARVDVLGTTQQHDTQNQQDDLKRIAKVTGGTLLSSFSDLTGEEVVDPASLGMSVSLVLEDEFIILSITVVTV